MVYFSLVQKSFWKPPTWVFFSLLLPWNILLSSSHPTYKWQDPLTKERLVCQQCPPGTFVAQYCTKDRPTQCQACPSLYYTHYWNYLSKCLYCNSICSGLEEEAQPCNATHDRVCQCKAGYYLDHSSDFCLPHSTCPLGSRVSRPGTPHEDTRCAECPSGTFSNSSTGVCQPHTNCSEHGLMLNVPGNRFHDTLCTTCKLNLTNGTDEWLKGASVPLDCEEALINMAVYQFKYPKLRMLKDMLEKETLPKESAGNQLKLQAEIFSYLTHVPNISQEISVIKNYLLRIQNHFSLKKRFSLKVRKQIRSSQKRGRRTSAEAY
ncbi:tumor necrosis factor receptor superfamily member 6B [Paroedura picta]|uniref:tumor necrosis factor receptor superfamily member 6B n=1 Tax=Paroedura picta TaxID=143630 RepID=UPI004055B050